MMIFLCLQIVTLTKPSNRIIGQKPADEQLHVLPMHTLDITNEYGNFQGVGEKIRTNALEVSFYCC